MADPQRYEWIQFETCPDEDNPNSFYLDDMVCRLSNGFFHFYQAKHRQDPDNKWTWDDFLKAARPRGTSIVKKWAESLLPRISGCEAAYFVTDGLPSDEIAPYLDGDHLGLSKIKNNQEIYLRLVTEIGSEEDAAKILDKIHFVFRPESLSDFESRVWLGFYENLSATEAGVTNLYYEIAKECRQRYPRRLDIETLRIWCQFDTPRPLEEYFEIPADFEFFDKDTHDSLLSKLQEPEGGTKVFFGKPGVGKSVYLSKLDSELRSKGVTCVKHHYHISPQDPNPQDRLNTDRVIEALKAQIKLLRDELGHLVNKDSGQIPIGEFIKTLAGGLGKKGKTLVIIIDGLDHVMRYGEKEDLERFLKATCVPQPGVWIVIGMQEIAEPHLPQIVIDRCPKNQWIEIKGLSRDAVTHLVSVNETGLHLPDRPEMLTSLANKLFEISDGNALHLRYSLKQLKNASGNSLVTEYSCENLIPYSEGIERYYEALWRQISPQAKTILITLSDVNFLFTEQQLTGCIAFSATNPADITVGLKQIAHLISINARNQISVYHNSFDIFLKDQPEMKQQKVAIKTNVKRWLEQSDYEYLKWAELRIIEHELGGSDGLLAIDRRWLIDAICYPCNFAQISNQMSLAAQVASGKGDLSKTFHISSLHTYYLNSREFVEEASEMLWRESFFRNRKVFEYIDLASLPIAVLPDLAEIAESRGEYRIVREITDVLIDRQAGQEYRRDSVPPISLALIRTVALDRDHETKEVHKYIVNLKDLNVSDTLFRVYASRLLALGQKEKLLVLIGLDLNASEQFAVIEECARFGLANNGSDFSSSFSEQADLPLLARIYQVLKKQSVDTDLPLPSHGKFTHTSPEHDFEERKRWQRVFHSSFHLGLLYGLVGKEQEIERWIAEAPDIWSAKAAASLLAAGLKVALGINGAHIEYSILFNSLSDLPVLKWPEHRSSLNFQFALKAAIDGVLRELVLIKQYIGDDCTINVPDYKVMMSNPAFFSRSDLVGIVLDIGKKFFSDGLYQKIRDEKAGELAHTVSTLPDRAKEYCNLAKLSRIHNDSEPAELFLAKTADNILGYGYHKDVYLFGVLEAIELCTKAGTDCERTDEWVGRVIPLVDSVGEYTDGDETRHLPVELADLLAKQNPGLLRKYYYWTADQELFYRSEDLFRSLLTSLSLTDDIEITLAATALEKDSLSFLKSMAKTNEGAKIALESIQSYLGEINYPKEEREEHYSSQKTNVDYSAIAPDHLLEHLNGDFEHRYEWNQYLAGWLGYWLEHTDKRDIYEVFEKIVEKFGTQSMFGEVLDTIYPVIYEFNPALTFDLLCTAQTNDHGWSQYYTDKKKAESRWRFVKEKYPNRYVEFFQKSAGRFVPNPRGVEYFLLFGDSKRAETISEASVGFAESLMADLSLPIPIWFKEETEISVLDILLQRLVWPSPAVRERTATGLARLLYKSENKKEIFGELLRWISRQKMETTVAVGLLPIVKAFSIAESPDDLSYIRIEDIANSISVNSEVVERLFDEITLFTKTDKPELPAFQDTQLTPTGYDASQFFLKHVQTFLAPIYMERAKEIEKNSFRQFIKHWAFVAEKILMDAGVNVDANQVYYYARNEHDEFLTGFSTTISEAYRSAFLRVLQYFYTNGHIQRDFYLKYAYATLPIDLSRWKILPNRAPKWWPKLATEGASGSGGTDKIVSIALKEPIEKLTDQQDSMILIGAQGAIEPADGWSRGTNPLHSFRLIAFGYQVRGGDLPTADQVIKTIGYSPRLAVIPSMTSRPFNFLEDKANHIPVREEPIQIGDLLIHPIVAYEQDLVIALWQYFREYNPALTLNWELAEGLGIVVYENRWEMQERDGKTLAVHYDWLEGQKERYYRDLPSPHGEYLMAEKDLIGRWLEEKNLRLGYVLKTTYRGKQYSYDEVKKYDEVKLINVSPIIVQVYR